MTPQENHLWYDYLQHYPLKIYKQRIIDNFIADFYCHKARLVIELDGSQHYTPDGKNYDGLRTDVIEKYKFNNSHYKKHYFPHEKVLFRHGY